MKTHFKSSLLLVVVMAAIVSLTSCSKEDITPTNSDGQYDNTDYTGANGTVYAPDGGPIVPQRMLAPLPSKKQHGKHIKGAVHAEPELQAN